MKGGRIYSNAKPVFLTIISLLKAVKTHRKQGQENEPPSDTCLFTHQALQSRQKTLRSKCLQVREFQVQKTWSLCLAAG